MAIPLLIRTKQCLLQLENTPALSLQSEFGGATLLLVWKHSMMDRVLDNILGLTIIMDLCTRILFYHQASILIQSMEDLAISLTFFPSIQLMEELKLSEVQQEVIHLISNLLERLLKDSHVDLEDIFTSLELILENHSSQPLNPITLERLMEIQSVLMTILELLLEDRTLDSAN